MVPTVIEFLFYLFLFSSYCWSFIPVRKQNSNKQTASGFASETCSRAGFKN